jgi:hypothetical protein
LIPYRKALALQIDPWKEVGASNWVPGHRSAAVWPNFSEPAAVSGRSWAGDGLWVPGARFPGSDGSEPQPAKTARASAPARLRPDRVNVWCGRLQGILVKLLGVLVAAERAGGGGSTAAAALVVTAVGSERWLPRLARGRCSSA